VTLSAQGAAVTSPKTITTSDSRRSSIASLGQRDSVDSPNLPDHGRGEVGDRQQAAVRYEPLTKVTTCLICDVLRITWSIKTTTDHYE